MDKISIIVPALNEEGNVTPLVDDLVRILQESRLDFEIVVVDDCSDDGTLEEIKNLQQTYSCVIPVQKDLPHGFGTTVRKGIQVASGRLGFVVSADNVDPIETIPQMVQKLSNEGCALVLLSRRLRKGDDDYIPYKYKFFQWGFRWLSIALLGLPFKDITYSYRGFSLDIIKRLSLESSSFEISPEITFKMWLHGYKIREIPGSPRVRTIGGSKFLFTKAGKGYPRVLLKALRYRFTGKW
ncbi:MAG: glycosyltransferase family 2 protein [Candidatus Aminicenantaceae bacterium]